MLVGPAGQCQFTHITRHMAHAPAICRIKFIDGYRGPSVDKVRHRHTTPHVFGCLAREIRLICGQFIPLCKSRLGSGTGRVFPFRFCRQAINLGPDLRIEPGHIFLNVQVGYIDYRMVWPKWRVFPTRLQHPMIRHISTAAVLNTSHPLGAGGLVTADRIGDIHFDRMSRMLVRYDVYLVGATPAPSRILAIKIKRVARLARYCAHHERPLRHDDHFGAMLTFAKALQRNNRATIC